MKGSEEMDLKEKETNTETLKKKVEKIANEYADLVEKRLIAALAQSEIDSVEMSEIENSIKMLNYAASTLERISRLDFETQTA